MIRRILGTVLSALVLQSVAVAAPGDPQRGAELYRACAACHSLVPGQHFTGPSLGEVWNRKAGAARGFARYSPALSAADLIWDAANLDAWLRDPAVLVPDNWMVFGGIDDVQARADLIAFLQRVSENPPASGGGLPDLKALPPSQQVAAIRHCGDTYRVTTGTDETRAIWEFNLRFKTDASSQGPPPGAPVLLPAGMRGDRFSVIFADPAEISAFIQPEC